MSRFLSTTFLTFFTKFFMSFRRLPPALSRQLVHNTKLTPPCQRLFLTFFITFLHIGDRHCTNRLFTSSYILYMGAPSYERYNLYYFKGINIIDRFRYIPIFKIFQNIYYIISNTLIDFSVN